MVSFIILCCINIPTFYICKESNQYLLLQTNIEKKFTKPFEPIFLFQKFSIISQSLNHHT